MAVRYRQRQCDDDAEDETSGGRKLPLWMALVCGRRRTVKSISTATQVTSLELAHKYADVLYKRFNTYWMQAAARIETVQHLKLPFDIWALFARSSFGSQWICRARFSCCWNAFLFWQIQHLNDSQVQKCTNHFCQGYFNPQLDNLNLLNLLSVSVRFKTLTNLRKERNKWTFVWCMYSQPAFFINIRGAAVASSGVRHHQ